MERRRPNPAFKHQNYSVCIKLYCCSSSWMMFAMMIVGSRLIIRHFHGNLKRSKNSNKNENENERNGPQAVLRSMFFFPTTYTIGVDHIIQKSQSFFFFLLLPGCVYAFASHIFKDIDNRFVWMSLNFDCVLKRRKRVRFFICGCRPNSLSRLNDVRMKVM